MCRNIDRRWNIPRQKNYDGYISTKKLKNKTEQSSIEACDTRHSFFKQLNRVTRVMANKIAGKMRRKKYKTGKTKIIIAMC